MKLSAYYPWGLPNTSTTSWMTLGSWVSFGGVGHNQYRSIFFFKPISQPIIEIFRLNFQDMILGVYQVHHIKNGLVLGGWAWSLKVYFLCSAYISANNRDIDTKLSGYDPWGLSTTSRTSWMTHGTWVSFRWVGMITIGVFSLFSLYLSQ